MNNTCEKYNAFFNEFIDNEIAESDSIELKEHLRLCSACRQRLLELENTDELIQKAFKIKEDELDLSGVWEYVDTHMDWGSSLWERIKNKFFKPIVWVPALCTAAVAIFVITFLPIQTGTKQMMISSVVEVSCTSGSTMVLKTAQSGTPIIMFFPDPEKEAG